MKQTKKNYQKPLEILNKKFLCIRNIVCIYLQIHTYIFSCNNLKDNLSDEYASLYVYVYLFFFFFSLQILMVFSCLFYYLFVYPFVSVLHFLWLLFLISFNKHFEYEGVVFESKLLMINYIYLNKKNPFHAFTLYTGRLFNLFSV